MGQWVNSRSQSKSLKNVINIDLIEIIQFCLKIYDLFRHPHPWVGVSVDWWFSESMGGGQVKSLKI